MKKSIICLLAFCLIFALFGCGQTSVSHDTETSGNASTTNDGQSQDASEPDETTRASESVTPESDKTGTLVVYFSCTGNTKAVAEKLAELCGADIFEIIPEEPYTSEDIDYNNDNCRANKEMNDENARPAIGSDEIDLSGYDTVLIGYPIWWGTMPRIINTFLDTYDLSGKVVLPFCTSGGSGAARSVSDIREAEPDADVRDGIRASGAGDSNLESWLVDNEIIVG